MRKIVLSLLLTAATGGLMAQDLDYPDFRSKKDNFSKINDKDIRNDLASFVMAGLDESIGKAVLKTLPVEEYDNNHMVFKDGDLTVIVKAGVFFPTKHKMMYSEKHLVKIDNKPYYGGNYGESPKATIASVTAIFGKDTVEVPQTALFDLYDPKFSFSQSGATRTKNGVYLSNDKHTIYIYMLNIENGGSEYTFVIRDKQYIRRVVDFGFLK